MSLGSKPFAAQQRESVSGGQDGQHRRRSSGFSQREHRMSAAVETRRPKGKQGRCGGGSGSSNTHCAAQRLAPTFCGTDHTKAARLCRSICWTSAARRVLQEAMQPKLAACGGWGRGNRSDRRHTRTLAGFPEGSNQAIDSSPSVHASDSSKRTRARGEKSKNKGGSLTEPHSSSFQCRLSE